MSKWIFNIGLAIAIIIGGILGYKIAFPSSNQEKVKSALIDNGDPDILGVRPQDIKTGEMLSDQYAKKIAKALAIFLLENQKDINERTCVGIFEDLNNDGRYDDLFLDKYTIEDLAPNELIVRYNGCSYLWYKNKEIVLSITTKTLLNHDVQDIGIKYVPSFVYTFEVIGNNPEKLKLKLTNKKQGLLSIDKFLIE